MKIGTVDTKKEPFIIAEIGGNHEGRFDYAKKMLLDAAKTGCHCIKYQIYTGDKIVSKVEGAVRNKHFKKFELTNEQYKELIKLAEENNMLFCASFWDPEAVDYFDPFVKFHKIGGGDFTNLPIIEQIAKKNKPILISTAMSNLEEIKEVVAFIDKVNPSLRKENKIALLQCVAMYGEPKDEHANLLSIKVLQDAFPDIEIGYSDHTKGVYACELALAMGATIIEKHFTDNKDQEFRDHHLSANPEEMIHLVKKAKQIQILHGKHEKKPVEAIEDEDRIQQFRRAVYPKADLPAGTILTRENTTTLRPNQGIDARKYYEILGNKLNKDKKAFESIYEEDLD